MNKHIENLTQLAAQPLPKDPLPALNGTLPTEVLEIFAEHMPEREFSIEEIATLGGVPVETLYSTFAASGVEPQPPVDGAVASVLAVVYQSIAEEIFEQE